MAYFNNNPYTLFQLKKEFCELYKIHHPKNGGNYESYKELLEEYNKKRKQLQHEKRKHANQVIAETEKTLNEQMEMPPAKGLTLEPITNGVAVVGDNVTTYKYRTLISKHGAKWDKDLKQWVAYKGTDVKTLCDWFGIDYEEMKLRIEDSTIPTIGKLAAMVENNEDTSEIKRVKVGRFCTFQDFIAYFGAHYLPAVENLSKGVILQNDMTILRYFADDMLMSFGFDIPENKQSTK